LVVATTQARVAGLLDESDRALLDSLLADFVGGPAVDFGTGNGAQLLNGEGPGGEKQGALTPGTGDTTGTIANGDVTMEVDIPAGLGLTFSGKDGQDSDAAGDYLNNQIAGYFGGTTLPVAPEPGQELSPEQEQQQSLTGAVNDLLGSLGGGKDISVRLIDFLGKTSLAVSAPLTTTDVDGGSAEDTFTLVNGSAPQAGEAKKEIFFDAGESKGKQVFALNMSKLGADTTLVVKNIEAALVAGPGSLRIDGTAGARVNSDNFGQNITGGGGNDTLVGGGNDTLTGGVGADIFGFSSAAKGNFTITDFNKTTDQIGLKLTGVSTFAQLQAAVTGGSYANGAMTYNLGPDISITLVGIGPNDITADMIKFTF
jgi:hypothetical protein